MVSAGQTVARATREPKAAARHVARVDFLGIGAQKTGTGWLYTMLGAHPEIFMAHADDKDLKFFSARYDYGHAWYERHFAADGGAKRRGEFSTSYFYSQEAPARVHRYNPDMRLLLSLRDPVDRLVSHHRHEIRTGRLGVDVPLEAGLASNPSYIEQSMYFTQLTRWLEHFPLASFHILIFEELFHDPARALRDLYGFVGVSQSFVPKSMHEKINEGRVPRSRLVDKGVRLSTTALRTMGAGWLVESLKRAGVEKKIKAANSRSGEALDARVAARLRETFASENEKLANLLGRDLSVWKRARNL
jgi:hypothetical protein